MQHWNLARRWTEQCSILLGSFGELAWASIRAMAMLITPDYLANEAK
jgi:hypothetical protein